MSLAMTLQPFHRLESRTAVIPGPDIDTDQIIPARYLKARRAPGWGATCSPAGASTRAATRGLTFRSRARRPAARGCW